jgi:hypothetical protein
MIVDLVVTYYYCTRVSSPRVPVAGAVRGIRRALEAPENLGRPPEEIFRLLEYCSCSAFPSAVFSTLLRDVRLGDVDF